MKKVGSTVESYPNYPWEEMPRSIRDMTTCFILSGEYHALPLTESPLFNLSKISLERRNMSVLSITL